MHSVIDRRWGEFLPDLSLLLVTVIWGLSFTILKEIMGDRISPILFVFLRFALASVILFPVCKSRIGSLGGKGIAGGVFLGVILFAGFITQSMGIEYTTASKSAFITGLSAVFVPVYLLIHRGRLPSPVVGFALMMAVFGMYLLTGPSGGGFNKGDFLTLICAVAFGGQIYVMGIVTVNRDPLALTFVELATTGVLAALFIPVETAHLRFSWGILGAVAFLSIFATAGALLVQTWAQKKTSAVKVGLIFTAEPLFAYMFASALLGEQFNVVQKLGGALIILAVLTAEVVPLILGQRKAQVR